MHLLWCFSKCIDNALKKLTKYSWDVVSTLAWVFMSKNASLSQVTATSFRDSQLNITYIIMRPVLSLASHQVLLIGAQILPQCPVFKFPLFYTVQKFQGWFVNFSFCDCYFGCLLWIGHFINKLNTLILVLLIFCKLHSVIFWILMKHCS